MGDISKDYNANEIANKFYDWLIDQGYRETEDKKIDIEDVILDFEHIKVNTPMLFHLLMDISDH